MPETAQFMRINEQSCPRKPSECIGFFEGIFTNKGHGTGAVSLEKRRVQYKQTRLIKLFIADVTAKTAASLAAVNGFQTNARFLRDQMNAVNVSFYTCY